MAIPKANQEEGVVVPGTKSRLNGLTVERVAIRDVPSF